MFDDNMSRRIVKVRSQIRKSVQKKNKLTDSVQPKPGCWSEPKLVIWQ